MTLFRSREKKEFIELASINEGRVAIILETQNGAGNPKKEAGFLVDSPRGYAIKMNELMMVRRSFNEKFSPDESTCFNYFPVKEKFTLQNDHIVIGERKVMLRKVPFYDSYLWDD